MFDMYILVDMTGDLSIFHFPIQKEVRQILPVLKQGNASSSLIPLEDAGSFSSLGISKCLCDNLIEMGISNPTNVQKSLIPALLSYRNAIACAETGCGKTAAFIIPILELHNRDPQPQLALIISPTRELSLQTAERIHFFGRNTSIRVALEVGGIESSHWSPIPNLEPHVIIATPGKFLEKIKTCHFTKRPKFLILDEADQLLRAGSSFMREELPAIIEYAGMASIWCLVSATGFPVLKEFMDQHRPGNHAQLFYQNLGIAPLPSGVRHFYILMPSQVREAHLILILKTLISKRVIIFVAKRWTCSLLHLILKEFGIISTPLHSGLKQSERSKSLSLFRSAKVPILISTDIASRGLDIEGVDVVVNVDMPLNIEDYIHRAGRTARASKSGVSISLLHELDVAIFREIQALKDIKIGPYPLPSSTNSELETIIQLVATTRRKVSMKLAHSKKLKDPR